MVALAAAGGAAIVSAGEPPRGAAPPVRVAPAFAAAPHVNGVTSAPAPRSSLADPAPVHDRLTVEISVAERRLWLLRGADTLLTAPAAVGSGERLEHEGRRWRFETPRGTRRVLARQRDPVWVPPLWHFVERAAEMQSPLVELAWDEPHEFPDGSRVLLRDGVVGHELAGGEFVAFEPGMEVVVNGILFVPPIGSANRRVAGELGAYKLDLGDGYLIHGTSDSASIGTASTHGCIRLDDDALRRLYEAVPVGTPVVIR